jgi:hypothetical protein
MATFLLVAAAVALIGALIYVLGAPDRHETMTEEEFEEEAKKKSLVGAALIGLHKAIQPGRTEHVMVQKHRVEKEGSTADGAPSVTSDGEDEKTDRS